MRIIFTINPDENGRITVTNVIKYIRQNVPQIRIPDGDITKIPLADLTLVEDNTKRCIDGYASGTRWKDGKYSEYEFTLIFR